MKPMRDLDWLIEKIEGLEGPSREVDLAVAECLGAGLEHTPTSFTGKIAWPGDTKCRPCPPYTTSFDAALALVDRLLPGAWYLIGKGKTRAAEPLYGAQIMFGSDDVIGEGEHDASLAIALCLALFRALQSQEKK